MKVYELIIDNKKVKTFTGKISQARVEAEGLPEGKLIFLCRQEIEGTIAVSVYKIKAGKVRKFAWDKDKVQVKFNAIRAKIERGGRPRVTELGAATLSVSVDRGEKQKFDLYAKKFAKGNRSEMFRRMFSSWEKMMENVIGEQVA